MRRLVLVLAGGAVVAGLVMAAASAAPPYKTLRGKLTCSNTKPAAGETITVSATGYAAGAVVSLAFDDVVGGTTTADASGAISSPFTIPESATKGNHTISATGPTSDGATLRATCTVRLSGAAAAASLDGARAASSARPAATSPAGPIALGAGAALGIAAVVAWRRRATRT